MAKIIKVWDGSAWQTVGTASAVGATGPTGPIGATGPSGTIGATGPSPLTTKGDLYTYNTNNTRLAVGTNGETLISDSTASTGLRWQGQYYAGKNKIINGDFGVNQRGFTSTTTTFTYIFDRFQTRADDGTSTFSAQTFTTGSAPVSGYEFKNFLQIESTGQTLSTARTAFQQPIEGVRNFAGQTATLSFWARATSGTPSVAAYVSQIFGTGGSAALDTSGQKVAITTSWERYSITFAIPSIAGKTIATDGTDAVRFFIFTSAGSFWNTASASLGIQSTTIQFAGIQVEAGSVATPFQTATGTLQGELAACQRYYWRAGGDSAYQVFGIGSSYNTTESVIVIPFPVTMRATPTVIDYNALGIKGNPSWTPVAVTFANNFNGTSGSKYAMNLYTVSNSLTSGNYYTLVANNSTSAYLGFGAEF